MPTAASSRQLVPFTQTARFAAKKNQPDVQFEKEVAQQKLKRDPENVTSESSVRHLEPPTRPASGTSSDGLTGDLVWPQ